MDAATEQRIRDAYQAFVSGDFDALNAFFARQGTEQLTVVWRSLHEMFEFEELDIREIREGPEGVFVELRLTGHGRVSGAPTLLSQSHLLKLRDERAVSLAWFGTREEGLRAAGLA